MRAEASLGFARVDLRYVGSTLARIALPAWFIVYATLTLNNYVVNGWVGIDVLLYRHAALAAVAGGNPWEIQSNGLAFAGPPSTLLLYLPMAYLSLPVATVLTLGLGVAASAWAVRRLELPLWWILFPPLFEALIVGNADVLVLALLLVRGPLAGLAAALKVYALIPLIAQRRWGPIGVFIAISAISLPLTPMFLANIGTVTKVLNEQTAGLSAWGTWLMVPTLLALFVLRRRGAEWLVVPAIWPNSQDHYGAMSLPAVRRSALAAAVIGLATPLAPPVAVIIMAVDLSLRQRLRSRREAAPAAAPAAAPVPAVAPPTPTAGPSATASAGPSAAAIRTDP